MKRSACPQTSRALLAICLALAVGCSGDEEFNANLAGEYTIAITNAASSCSFDWTEGEMASGIPFTVTQDGQNINGTVGGLAAISIALLLGTTTFAGTVSGLDFSMVAHGVNSQLQGNCTYTYDATIDGTSNGDTLEGTVTYSPRTNGNTDCAAVLCSAEQRFAGSRPPK